MSNVPRISGEEAIKAFGCVGFRVARINGSHHILKREGTPALLSIPVHRGKTIGIGLLRSQIDAAKMTVKEFKELL